MPRWLDSLTSRAVGGLRAVGGRGASYARKQRKKRRGKRASSRNAPQKQNSARAKVDEGVK